MTEFQVDLRLIIKIRLKNLLTLWHSGKGNTSKNTGQWLTGASRGKGLIGKKYGGNWGK